MSEPSENPFQAEETAHSVEVSAAEDMLDALPEEEDSGDFGFIFRRFLAGFLRSLLVLGMILLVVWFIWSGSEKGAVLPAQVTTETTQSVSESEGIMTKVRSFFQRDKTKETAVMVPEKNEIEPVKGEEKLGVLERIKQWRDSKKKEKSAAEANEESVQNDTQTQTKTAQGEGQNGERAQNPFVPEGVAYDDLFGRNMTEGYRTTISRGVYGESTNVDMSTTGGKVLTGQESDVSKSEAAGVAQQNGQAENTEKTQDTLRTDAANPVQNGVFVHEWIADQIVPMGQVITDGELEGSVVLLTELEQLFSEPMIRYVTADTNSARQKKVDEFESFLQQMLQRMDTKKTMLAQEFDQLSATNVNEKQRADETKAAVNAVLNDAETGQVDALLQRHIEYRNNAYTASARADARRVAVERFIKFERAIVAITDNLAANKEAIIAGVKVLPTQTDPFERILTPEQWEALRQ